MSEIRDFYGRTTGYLEDDGNKIVAKDYYGHTLGTYDKESNETRNFYGQRLGEGNSVSSLIPSYEEQTGSDYEIKRCYK